MTEKTCMRILLLVRVLAVAVCVLASPTGCSNAQSDESIAASCLPNLLIGDADLPKQAVLLRLDITADQSRSECSEVWSGPVVQGEKARGYSYRIQTDVTESAAAAQAMVRSSLLSVPEPPTEVTGKASYAAFRGRVWHKGGRLVLMRNNVVTDIFVGDSADTDHAMLLGIASHAARKVEACIAGEPEPLPVVSLAADQELRVSLEDAWKLRNLGGRLWGEKATIIAVRDTNGLPRSLPAKETGIDDYLVPLRHLAAILGPRARVDVRGNEAKVTLGGQALSFCKGESQVRMSERVAPLGQTVIFADGEVLVPLSPIVQEVLGKRLVWEKRDSVPIGRLEAEKAQ